MHTTQTTGTSDVAPEPMTRRSLLGAAAVAGIGATLLGFAASAQAADRPNQPEAETGNDYPKPLPNAKNEKAFRAGVMPIAVISRTISALAVDKATDPKTKEFANFELREAIGIGTVLKEMNTPMPPMSAKDKALVESLKAAEGAEFDKLYITAQLGAHQYLRDHAETYLQNTVGAKGMAEMHGRHLAMVSLATFKEHVVLCKNILGAV